MLEFNNTTTAIEGAFVGDASGQVWNYNGIKVTAEKNQSNTDTFTNVTNHARFYKGNSFKVEYAGMSKIVINCAYADRTDGFTGLTLDGATATVEGKVITIIFTQPTDVFSVAALANQIRVSSIEIYALA